MVVFEDLQIAYKTIRARFSTAVEQIAICLLAGPNKLPAKVLEPIDNKRSLEDKTDPNKPTVVKVYFDELMHIVMEEKDENITLKFRQGMNKVLLKKLKTRKLPLNEADEISLEAVATVLT